MKIEMASNLRANSDAPWDTEKNGEVPEQNLF